MNIRQAAETSSMKLWKLALALAVMPLFSGCIETIDSDQVSEESIYQTYRLTYSEESRQLVGSASFHVGGPWGTSVRLQSPSRVLLNGKPLEAQSFLGITYEGRWTVPFSAGPHRWQWIDQQNTSHSNSLSIVPFQLENPPRFVSLNTPVIFTMSGPTLSSEDSWGVWITQPQLDGSTRSAFLQTQVLDARRLQALFRENPGLTEGSALLQIRRTQSTGLQEVPARSGTVFGTYEGTPIQIQLTR